MMEYILPVMLLVVGSVTMRAQTIYFPDGIEYVKKISNDSCLMRSSDVFFQSEDGKYWKLPGNDPALKEQEGYAKATESRINYYNGNHDLRGYCVLAEKRFYRTVATGDTIHSETPTEVLFNGIVYGGPEGGILFRVDKDFPLNWLGFFLLR